MRYLLLLLLLLSTGAQAHGPYPAELVRVIDGDTVVVRAEVWPGLFQEVSVRLAGVNAPESRRRVGRLACEITLGKLATAYTTQFLTGPLVLYDVKLGKFAGRVLGQIRTARGDLSTSLVLEGHAVAYDGGKRAAWVC